MLDISDDDLQLIQSILREIIPQYEVIAFGSRVSGKATQYSDLDLAVKTTTGLTLTQMTNLAEAFSNSTLPFKVDIVDWFRASPEFKAIIMQQTSPIQSATG